MQMTEKNMPPSTSVVQHDNMSMTEEKPPQHHSTNVEQSTSSSASDPQHHEPEPFAQRLQTALQTPADNSPDNTTPKKDSQGPGRRRPRKKVEAEYYRDYRRRKKAGEKKAAEKRALQGEKHSIAIQRLQTALQTPADNSPDNTTSKKDLQGPGTGRPRKKVQAEYFRNYRRRKKAAENRALQGEKHWIAIQNDLHPGNTPPAPQWIIVQDDINNSNTPLALQWIVVQADVHNNSNTPPAPQWIAAQADGLNSIAPPAPQWIVVQADNSNTSLTPQLMYVQAAVNHTSTPTVQITTNEPNRGIETSRNDTAGAGSTYTEIVYEYDRRHPQSLVYVALSPVTSIEGLVITITSNDGSCRHSRRPLTAIVHRQDEFKRLAMARLKRIDVRILEFLQRNQGLSIYTFNCQSICSHSQVIDCIIRKMNMSLLCETWLNKNETISIPNFNCIIQYNRSNVRVGRMGIYHNQMDTVNLVTPKLQLTVIQSNFQNLRMTDVGDICVAQCRTEDGKVIVMAAIYISIDQKVKDIIAFIHETLLTYTAGGAALLGSEKDKLPLILAGDFNVNFASPESQPLLDFLKEKLNLTINNNPNIASTRHRTTLDAIFSRYTRNIRSKVHISFLSYYKPIVTNLAIESTAHIEEIN